MLSSLTIIFVLFLLYDLYTIYTIYSEQKDTTLLYICIKDTKF